MEIKILKEAGYEECLLGLSLSRNQPIDNMEVVAYRLAGKGKGHDKFLESIVVWLDIRAARYWWQQFDTYRIGVTKQSESTMYRFKRKQKISRLDFEREVDSGVLERLNCAILRSDFWYIKNHLPEGFLQRRLVCTNYKALMNIIVQRYNHKLNEWKVFCKCMIENLEHREFFENIFSKSPSISFVPENQSFESKLNL